MGSAQPVFTTERLVVRPWTPDDTDALFDILGRWEVAQWLGAVPKALESAEAAVATIERWATFSEPDPTYGIWAMVPTGSTRPVGTVLLKALPDADGTPTPDIEVGWHLNPEVWGCGYATEAARGALARGFAAGLAEVLAVVRPGNARSVAVCERLGMERLGLVDRYYGQPLETFRARRPA